MKVYIERAFDNPEKIGGKALFRVRLAAAMSLDSRVEVTDDAGKKVDVSLNVIRLKHENSRKKILRLNGVWHDTGKNYAVKNRGMTESLKKAEGVVYQSYHSQRLCNTFLGEPDCPSKVILNGSDPSFYNDVKPINFGFKNIILAFSKWRPHKRLKDIIESFLLAEVSDGLLVVAGDVSNSGMDSKELEAYFGLPEIHYAGMVSQKGLAGLLKAAKASVHLCWFDACPNSVVEAVVAGVPVITNNVGGTWEIVKPSGGWVCNIDEPYDYRPVDLYHPPPIDRWQVADAINQIVNSQYRPVISCDHVHIKNTAQQYLDFMRKVLNG